jgi:hypothetical protein
VALARVLWQTKINVELSNYNEKQRPKMGIESRKMAG